MAIVEHITISNGQPSLLSRIAQAFTGLGRIIANSNSMAREFDQLSQMTDEDLAAKGQDRSSYARKIAARYGYL